ncbi:MAG: hypothetical protein M1150_03940 [Patescibacteria group bacterium]|nr:hypothetical protein [Patescibacteria group bacterium]
MVTLFNILAVVGASCILFPLLLFFTFVAVSVWDKVTFAVESEAAEVASISRRSEEVETDPYRVVVSYFNRYAKAIEHLHELEEKQETRPKEATGTLLLGEIKEAKRIVYWLVSAYESEMKELRSLGVKIPPELPSKLSGLVKVEG